MQTPDAATLNCPNSRCQAPNPQSHKFCQKCRTPLLKRYLWAVGDEGIQAYRPGDILAGRYLVERDKILLDTKPGLVPETPEEIPPDLAPYLKLSPYQLHVPQVYGIATTGDGRRNKEIWLLEQVPVYSGGSGVNALGQLMPEIANVWKNAPPLRQLHWLWQIACLWQPMSVYSVASSLLNGKLLRVEGSLVRLLELQEDTGGTATLQQLGTLWSQWATEAHPLVANFLEQLCASLTQGGVQTSEQLVAMLERGIADCGQISLGEAGTRNRHNFQIVTLSDKGPSRRRNEDACYPPSGTALTTNSDQPALAIVCDGIGGHEGGDVASSMAIETIRQRVESMPLSPTLDLATLTTQLENAACAANDQISQRNDTEKRHERQRMGTTLVMGLAIAPWITITHVGDSRVYRISRTGCHQVTQDDDLASREVRLGYALYRNAVQQPTSGSLVQALGMGSSATLHPTVQRFVLDEDCIFLLCSDGLSDNDRVEQYWETEILPILEGQISLAAAGQRLLQLGNTQNGHDNVTVGLVYCQVPPQAATGGSESTVMQMGAVPPPSADIASATPSAMKTQQLPQVRASGPSWPMLLGTFLVLGMLGGTLVHFWPSIVATIGAQQNPAPSEPAILSSDPEIPKATPSSVSSVTTGAQIKILSSTAKNSKGENVSFLLRPEFEPPKSQEVLGIVPRNSVLQVIDTQQSALQEGWLKLRVCSTPTLGVTKEALQPPAPKKLPSPSKTQGLQPSGGSKPKPNSVQYIQAKQGQVGWIRASEVESVSQILDPGAAEQCGGTEATPGTNP
jgi:serine/threonine protein phosphatase PrpC